jgi:hypothetical protein
MANFKTHLQFSTIGSGLASTALMSTHTLNTQDAFICWLAGSVGGILPDIDSDNSYSLSILFGFFSLIACIGVVVYTLPHWPLYQVWGLCLAVYLLMQYGVRKVFEAFTVHRGACHSLLAGLASGLLGTTLAHALGKSATSSWFIGAFLSFGFLLHLLLDELYSVDFSNASIKRSFGSAIKIVDYSNLKSAALLTSAVIVLFMLSPTVKPFSSEVKKVAQRFSIAALH